MDRSAETLRRPPGLLLFSEAEIAREVRRLGSEISADYAGKVPLLVGVLNSAMPFLADLCRSVTIPCEFDAIALRTFSDAEGIRFEKDTSGSVEGRHVIVVDDATGTGRTLRYLVHALAARKPASLAVCTLLYRQSRHADIECTYRAFEIPAGAFVVGYGLDDAGRYRELPELYVQGRSFV